MATLGWAVVSIPFKRERGFKELDGNSTLREQGRFQFPSNGKGDSKFAMLGGSVISADPLVSIPFKRERGFKGTDPLSECLMRHVSIPFKRERGFKGRTVTDSCQQKKFQFPSNGKGDSKLALQNEARAADEEGFNSLQTGKGIQRQFRCQPKRATNMSFNSLQTGKGIQRPERKVESVASYKVSIPFKRERGFKAKWTMIRGVAPRKVSIPFKRERGFKATLF